MPHENRHTFYCGLALFVGCLVVYSLTNFGGILSPDSEVVFRSAENFAHTGSFSVAKNLEGWNAFGVPRGKDGKLYPVFGLGQSIALWPFIRVTETLGLPDRFKDSPLLAPLDVSMQSVQLYSDELLRPHALRFFCSVYNILVTAFAVLLFWRILLRMGFSGGTSSFVTVLFAFGTLMWPYSATFFSEPLAILCTLASFAFLLKHGQEPNAQSSFLCGLFLGFAALVHISSILFVPFFLFHLLTTSFRQEKSGSRMLTAALSCAAGLAISLGAIGYYNYFRFGSLFETGRTVDLFNVEKVGYGKFTFSWIGLVGLLLGGGKGLLVYCPVTLLALVAWPEMHRRDRLLSWTLASACFFRWIFISMRSDWDGGFCLGPRYLLLLLPFLMLPIACWIEQRAGKSVAVRACALLVSVFAVCQQLYFSLGDALSYYYALKSLVDHKIIALDSRAMFYVRWDHSPVLYLHHGVAGPFQIRYFSVEYPFALWMLLAAILGVAVIFLQDHFLEGLKETSVTSPV